MQAEEWQPGTKDADAAKSDVHLKRMDRDIGVLRNSIKSKEAEFEACKTKFLKLVEEYTAVNDATEQYRTDFNLSLKLLQQPKPKNMVPLYDSHLDMVTSFFKEQNQVTDELAARLEPLLGEINIPDFRYLNVQTSLHELADLKNACLKEYAMCRDEIQQVEDSQAGLDYKLANMSDFNTIPLTSRIGSLDGLKQGVANFRKQYSKAYLKNKHLAANNNANS